MDESHGRLIAELEAPAKLTVDLRITGVRPDGYHTLEAEMVSLDLCDTVYLYESDRVEVVVVDGATDVPLGDDNLVARALRLAGRTARAVIIKRIPSQAGLGGGSADAGAVLRWAGFSDLEAAAAIGADVPFCLVGGRAQVGGIGEMVRPLPFAPITFTLLTPPIGCPTPAVYRRWDELGGPSGKNGNDLEPAALDLIPELARWRDQLGAAASQTPRLAGSGSTWFVVGAFPGEGRVVASTIDAPRVCCDTEPGS